MDKRAERFGFSAEEWKRLNEIWNGLKGTVSEETFGSIEEFARWSKENGYVISKQLTPKDFRRPITPENAYWKYRDIPETDAERAARVTLTKHPCEECPKRLNCDTACYLRKKWWDIGMEKLRERIGI